NMKHRLHEPRHLVSLRRVPELRGFAIDDEELVLGAGEPLAAIATDPRVRTHAPALAAAAGQVAGPQLRNMGTLGGNLCLDTRCTYYNQTYFWRRSLGFCLKKDGDTCHVTQVGTKCVAAHSADTPPVLWALGASADLVSPRGRRSVPVEDFFVADGVANTVRRPDEVVTRLRIPLPRPGTRMAFRKVRPRRAIDFPSLNLAAVAELEPDDRVRSLRIVVSGLGARPRELSGLDDVAGGRLDEAVVEAVAARAFQQCRPLTNNIVDPEWRRAMVPVYVRRALTELRGSATARAG
ncbi:MAG: 4-hydroxybenzoyl-CoA reductase subunit beta, partial [Gemmatimonadetes bacterium]|nr:4-hydroxybenzoyl-CoA reductase subunit beta [Gemmatimonadota bacterium]NIQ54323.1 4-hydroxybenzoyl-CoA reductase subunit beta [Gemmatimonadota bacterium]NIU74533.1 4-hydroxybenzoyl-CoA reductase subunit beta [Gammaproteobacteria bacterium]NIX44474.1 4-hydroxybenzoyl-CoA reductase subunit beta [Gemmatimonadota bacterium]NIY08702.1 4-hydroxybenzoyl-CoA reductase subunit beta [Gemmatimonadota bacterium]